MSDFIYVAGKNDSDARDRAFYLLKKYTSATLLQRSIDLYREFLRDFEREIKRPENAEEMQRSYQDDLLYFLGYLKTMEYAEPLLANPARRTEAFKLLQDAVSFNGFMWGRRYEEWGASEPGTLFYRLGYRLKPYDSVGVFAKADLSGSLISLMSTTISLDGIKRGVVYMANGYGARLVKRWTFESIFFDSLPKNSIPPIVFPDHLPACPPPNGNNDGEVFSGQRIPVTGIWEPWPLDMKKRVRCPNYFLAGDTASQYQMEGADTLEDVRWRLIWKESRYANGHIPYEEEDYFKPVVVPPPRDIYLRAEPGEVCPESGEWFAPNLDGKRVRVNAGETMPGQKVSRVGDVTWYLKKNT
jgi:hypothetical protein